MSSSAKSYRQPSESASLHVRIERSLVERLDRQASKRVVSRAKLFEVAVRNLVEKMEEQDDQQSSGS